MEQTDRSLAVPWDIIQYSILKDFIIQYHSAGKHDRGPLFLHYFHLDSSEVVQLVQFKFKIF